MSKSDELKALREKEALKMSGKSPVKATMSMNVVTGKGKIVVPGESELAKTLKNQQLNKDSVKKVEKLCKTTGKVDKRKQNKGRPPSQNKKIPSDAYKTTTQLTEGEKIAARANFGSIRDAVLWANANFKGKK